MPEQGIVKWYSVAKGYGFISRDANGDDDPTVDIFVHYSDLTTQALNEGERVHFEVVSGPKGLKACNVALTEATDR